MIYNYTESEYYSVLFAVLSKFSGVGKSIIRRAQFDSTEHQYINMPPPIINLSTLLSRLTDQVLSVFLHKVQ